VVAVVLRLEAEFDPISAPSLMFFITMDHNLVKIPDRWSRD